LTVEETKLGAILGALLRVGVSLAALVSVVAIVLLFVRGTGEHVRAQTFHGEPTSLRTLRGILIGAAALQPKPAMQLGLLILIATPVARVTLSVVGFVWQRDRFYTLITLLVLALLVAGLLGVTA
jgi:uncharacterized membrane protein